MFQIQAPCPLSALASTLEEFISKADTFLKNHYKEDISSIDVRQIMQAINNLQLDVDTERLEQEFDLHCDRKDLEADYYDSAWF
jgi:hypothetical protein